jgi:hypothetical protein
MELVDLLERLLYASSPTVEEYMDKSKLKVKLKEITIRVLRRRLQQKRRKG